MTTEKDQFVLDIEWDRPDSSSPVLPSLVGPFASREEAFNWARLNVVNGSYIARPMADPYSRVARRG